MTKRTALVTTVAYYASAEYRRKYREAMAELRRQDSKPKGGLVAKEIGSDAHL